MKTKITFKLESDTSVSIIRENKVIGQVYSESEYGSLPFPHDKTKEVCKNSIQLCGFDDCSKVWSCGHFHGKKDLVVNFNNDDNEFSKEQLKIYENYVKDFIKYGICLTKLKPFLEWAKHMGHPSIDLLRREKL